MITIDPIKRPSKVSSSVDTEEIMKEIDLKIADALSNNDSLISCIPLVEELDSDASLGTLVRYKLDISIDKIETIIKETSIRELNLFPTSEKDADIVGDLNFKIPSEYPSFNESYWCGFVLLNMSEQIMIKFWVGYDEGSYVLYCDVLSSNNEPIYFNLIYNNTVDDSAIKALKEQYLNTELYYAGSAYPDIPITEEEFDFIDCIVTINDTEIIKTTEEITKVVPYIKQQHGWESLITENSDFNNDFNLDFN